MTNLASTDICPFFNPETQVFEFDSNDKTAYPPGDYEIAITGTVQNYANNA